MIIDSCNLAAGKFNNSKVGGIDNKGLVVTWPGIRIRWAIAKFWAVERSLINFGGFPFFLVSIGNDFIVSLSSLFFNLYPLVNLNMSLQLESIHVLEAK